MSINDYWDKIKSKLYIDITTFMCLLVIILVSLSSFLLGRLLIINQTNGFKSKLNNISNNDVKDEIGNKINTNNISNLESNNIQKKKNYVASKNGKLYYNKDCSGAKRISQKNEIWFATKIEAEKSGYSISPSCI